MTGGGFATRKLYSDEDESLFDAQRPVLINGIEFAVRPDLADRLIFLTMPPIDDRDRSDEAEFWAQFEVARPRILGALLTAVSHGLRELPNTKLERLPRMADFARWATACEGALFDEGSFRKAYARNRKRATVDVIESDPVADAVRKLVEDNEWTGTASELLGRLGLIAGEKMERQQAWPKSPSALSRRLKRIATALRRIGIEIEHERDAGIREIVIRRRLGKKNKRS
jgi:hypothetical protein